MKVSPGANPIRNIIYERTDYAAGQRPPEQGQHHSPVGAKHHVKLIMMVGVTNHGIPH